MRRILFQGKTCVKVISHYKHPKMEAEVTPLVVIQDGKDPWGEDELQWGMVLQCTPQLLLEEDKTGVSLGEPFELGNTYSGWNEPILWWRVLQLFEVIHAIDHHFHLDLLIASNAVESFNIHREHPEWTYRPLPINE